jgi:ubiquinone/menaquinone biosynthesis C-methylase UbiE
LTETIEKALLKVAKEALSRIGVKPGLVLLDFGARIGIYSIPALNLVGVGGRVVALDKDMEALESLRRTSGKPPSLEIVKTGGELDLPFPDNYFDIVLFFDVIQHVSEPDYLLTEFMRVLKPEGRLAVYIPHEGDIQIVLDSPFILDRSVEQEMVHWDKVEAGVVYMFSPPQNP